MAITSVTPTSIAAYAQAASSLGATSLDSTQFMQLLLAQMRNQNPLEPMNDKEMISQLAQLNSMQTLQKISSSLDKLVSHFEGNPIK